MTVKALIEELQKLNQDAIVILQKAGEDNGYSPVVGAEGCFYRADTTWSGEAVQGDEEDPREDGDAPAVVLWPVN